MVVLLTVMRKGNREIMSFGLTLEAVKVLRKLVKKSEESASAVVSKAIVVLGEEVL